MKTPMDLLLIVPARSGSVRLPNKNKRMFLGKPLYAWTLTFIEEIGLKSKTILSTDDQEIAREAIKMGFDVPWLRPAQLAKSATTSSTVVTHAIQASNLAFSNNSLVALLQVTTPFREKSTFERLLELASEPEEVGAVSVQEVSGGGYSLNSLERLVKGEGDVHGEDCKVAPTGAYYFRKIDNFLKSGELSVGSRGLKECQDLFLIDIDNQDQWNQAEQLGLSNSDHRSKPSLPL